MIGRIINNYEIRSVLGEGGMGTVYLCEHTFITRRVAIKVLRPIHCADPESVARFMSEARASNAIGHPNIIDIIDVGRLDDQDGQPGPPYLMMECLEGETLAQRLRRTGKLSLPEALPLAKQATAALTAAHAAGILHRDLKPENLFLAGDAMRGIRLKVLDFGIAKLHDGADVDPVNPTGGLLGSPSYLSPEQCRGPGAEIDARADVYAIGTMLFEMLCGEVPFASPKPGDVVTMQLTATPRRARTLNPELPVWIEYVIDRALAKDPNDRFASMEALGAALEAGPQLRLPPDWRTIVTPPPVLVIPAPAATASEPLPALSALDLAIEQALAAPPATPAPTDPAPVSPLASGTPGPTATGSIEPSKIGNPTPQVLLTPQELRTAGQDAELTPVPVQMTPTPVPVEMIATPLPVEMIATPLPVAKPAQPAPLAVTASVPTAAPISAPAATPASARTATPISAPVATPASVRTATPTSPQASVSASAIGATPGPARPGLPPRSRQTLEQLRQTLQQASARATRPAFPVLVPTPPPTPQPLSRGAGAPFSHMLAPTRRSGLGVVAGGAGLLLLVGGYLWAPWAANDGKGTPVPAIATERAPVSEPAPAPAPPAPIPAPEPATKPAAAVAPAPKKAAPLAAAKPALPPAAAVAKPALPPAATIAKPVLPPAVAAAKPAPAPAMKSVPSPERPATTPAANAPSSSGRRAKPAPALPDRLRAQSLEDAPSVGKPKPAPKPPRSPAEPRRSTTPGTPAPMNKW